MADDTRMRYEKSHPMYLTPAASEELTKRWDAIDWTKGEPNQAKPRKRYPVPKAYRKAGL